MLNICLASQQAPLLPQHTRLLLSLFFKFATAKKHKEENEEGAEWEADKGKTVSAKIVQYFLLRVGSDSFA